MHRLIIGLNFTHNLPNTNKTLSPSRMSDWPILKPYVMQSKCHLWHGAEDDVTVMAVPVHRNGRGGICQGCKRAHVSAEKSA